MRGRKPTPPALKRVMGNPGKRPIVKPRAGVPGNARKPCWLSPDAAAEWDRLAPSLCRVGVLTAADAAFFAAYCEAVATYGRANAKLCEQGELVLDADGTPVRNPWLRVRADAAAELHRFGSEFGLSPAIRARFTLAECDAAPEDDDPASRYFTR